MKPRRVAALTLVGWYLMLPPMINGQPATNEPLSTWTIWHAFDTATDCEANRDFKAKQMRELFKKNSADADKWGTLFGVDSQCVASDDPRLKGK